MMDLRIVILTLLSSLLLAVELPPAERAVPLTDPYDLGERLVLIDYLREQGYDIEPGAALSVLREHFWQLHKPNDELRDTDIPADDVLLLRLDMERRRIAVLRERIQTLERELSTYQDLIRTNQDLSERNKTLELRLKVLEEFSGRFAEQQAEIERLRQQLRADPEPDTHHSRPLPMAPVVIAPVLPKDTPPPPRPMQALPLPAPTPTPIDQPPAVTEPETVEITWLVLTLLLAGLVAVVLWRRFHPKPEQNGGWLVGLDGEDDQPPEAPAQKPTDYQRFAPPDRP